MKERPIIMTGESVRAILDGRKTQTRRVVRPQPVWRYPGNDSRGHVLHTDSGTGRIVATVGFGASCEQHLFPLSPYGQPGDRLWVRESWGTVRMHELGQHIYGGPRIPDHDETVYRAGKIVGVPIPGTSPIQFKREWRDGFQPARWRSPIHMHRWLSRITLEITGVRVERLQTISKDDCVAEGLKIPCNESYRPLLQLSGKFAACQYAPFNQGREAAESATMDDYFRAYYASLWDTLNFARGLPWSSNPFVWTLDFKRIDADAKAAA